MTHRHLVDGIDETASRDARASSDQYTRALPGTDEHVLGPGRAVHEVPCVQPSLLALHDQQALARQDEEILLCFLAVVHAARLSGTEDGDVEPELGEAGVLSLERRVVAQAVAVEPLGISRIDDEPTFAGRKEAGLVPLERSLGNHRL